MRQDQSLNFVDRYLTRAILKIEPRLLDVVGIILLSVACNFLFSMKVTHLPLAINAVLFLSLLASGAVLTIAGQELNRVWEAERRKNPHLASESVLDFVMEFVRSSSRRRYETLASFLVGSVCLSSSAIVCWYLVHQ